MKDAVSISAGTAGLTNPLWLDWLPEAWQLLIAFLGFLVLVMTFWSKVLDIQIKRKTLSEMLSRDTRK